jgi:hypothetical protein
MSWFEQGMFLERYPVYGWDCGLFGKVLPGTEWDSGWIGKVSHLRKVILKSAKDRFYRVDTPGQQVSPCVQYATACLLIRST